MRRSLWNRPDIEVDFKLARRTRKPVSFIILDLFDDSECTERVSESCAFLILSMQLHKFICFIFTGTMHKVLEQCSSLQHESKKYGALRHSLQFRCWGKRRHLRVSRMERTTRTNLAVPTRQLHLHWHFKSGICARKIEIRFG